jgi:hypothetical protein
VLPLVAIYAVFQYVRDFVLLYWRGYRIVHKDEIK